MAISYKQSTALIIAASFASTIGGLPFNSLPILLGSLSDTFGFTAQTVGLLGSICFAGYLIGTLSSVVLISRFCLRKLTLTCSFFTICLLVLSSFSGASWQMLLWAMIGFFAALMTCLGLKILGQMINKERALGTRQGIELSVTALALFILPAYIINNYGYQGAAYSLSLIILLLSISILWLPRNSHTEEKIEGIKSQLVIPPIAWFALFMFLIFATGNIGLWAFLERMANSINLAPSQVGIVFAVLKLLGGAAAFSVALVGNRLGLRVPYYVVIVVLLIGLMLIWLSFTNGAYQFVLFASGVWIWEVAFTWGCVFQTAAVARIDKTGKAIMLIPAAFGMSAMFGPMLGGYLASIDFIFVLILAFISSILAITGFVGPLATKQILVPSTRLNLG